MLDCRRILVDRIVERQRAVEDRAGNLAAVGHLAQCRGLDRRGDLGIDRLHRRQDRHAHLVKLQRMAEVDSVLDDVDLGVEIGRDVYRSIGDDQRVLVAGNIHHKAVADAPGRADAALASDHSTHQLVRVQTALHQGLGLAFADELDRFCRRIVAVRRLLQRKAGYVELRPLGDVANAIGRPDQDRGDQTEPRRLYGTLERDFVTWMGHRRGHRFVGREAAPRHRLGSGQPWPPSVGRLERQFLRPSD